MNYEREDDASASTKLTYLLIGGGIGAILALLFAPKSGQELREDIADATRKGIEKGKETAGHLQDAAEEYYEVTREKASELYTTASERAEELSDKAKAGAAQSTNPISAAIDAGKKAYVDELKRSLNEMVEQRDAAQALEEQKAKIMEQNRDVRFQVMQDFLNLRGNNERNPSRWAAILVTEEFNLKLPVTEFSLKEAPQDD